MKKLRDGVKMIYWWERVKIVFFWFLEGIEKYSPYFKKRDYKSVTFCMM